MCVACRRVPPRPAGCRAEKAGSGAPAAVRGGDESVHREVSGSTDVISPVGCCIGKSFGPGVDYPVESFPVRKVTPMS